MSIPDRVIERNTVFCLRCHAGMVAAPFGVKHGNRVLVTEEGCELLSAHLVDDVLLGPSGDCYPARPPSLGPRRTAAAATEWQTHP